MVIDSKALIAAIRRALPPGTGEVGLHEPEFLGNSEYISYGRLQPAHINTLVYGWGMQAALGVMLWLMARRSGQELKSGKSLLIVAGVFWNITISFGILAILMGKSTSMEWLEMPKFVWPVLLTCFLCYAWPIARMR